MKKIMFLIFIVSTFSFGQVIDSGNYLTVDEKQEIEQKVLEIEKNADIVYYVNIGRRMDEEKIMEKTIILNIIPDGNSYVNVEWKITQDIDTSLYEEKMNSFLDEQKVLIDKKDYKTYILGILELSNNIVKEIEVEKKELQKQEVKKTFVDNKFAGILVLILIAIAIFTTLKFIKMKGIKR